MDAIGKPEARSARVRSAENKPGSIGRLAELHLSLVHSRYSDHVANLMPRAS